MRENLKHGLMRRGWAGRMGENWGTADRKGRQRNNLALPTHPSPLLYLYSVVNLKRLGVLPQGGSLSIPA